MHFHFMYRTIFVGRNFCPFAMSLVLGNIFLVKGDMLKKRQNESLYLPPSLPPLLGQDTL